MTFLRHSTTMLCVLLLLVFASTSFSFSQAEGDTPYNGATPAIRSSSNLHNPNRPNDAIVVVLPGNGSTSGNGRAPQGSRLFVNTKYLITGAEMTASGFGANQVSSIGWRWNAPRPTGAGAPVAQSVATTGNLKVFLKDTTSGATGLIGTFIDTNGVGYTKVIDATISITRTDTLEFTVDVAAGGPGTSPFTPTPGNGLLVIFVYQTTTPLATPIGAPTVFCTNVGATLTYQSQTVNGTTGTASTFRPETRFGSAPAGPTYDVPEIIYLKFNAGSTTTPNYAVPGRGNATATVTGHTIAPGGEFDSTLLGGEGTGATNWVDNAWAPNLGNGSWTIGFWASGLHLPATISNPCYLFGDVNTAAFRCFWAGAGISAVDTAILLRHTGSPDIRLVLPNPSLGQPSYVHFVYDSASATLKGYRNGVLGVTGTWTAPALNGAGPFKIAGYSTAASSLVSGAKLDEFRFYSRALDTLEIQRTWNHTLPYTFTTDVTTPTNEVPSGYELAQNYPNPFNPTTTIRFGIPATANVTVKVYNVLGQEVVTLFDGLQNPGTFQAVWDGRNSKGFTVASGMYFYSLTARSADSKATYTNIKKMLLLK